MMSNRDIRELKPIRYMNALIDKATQKYQYRVLEVRRASDHLAITEAVSMRPREPFIAIGAELTNAGTQGSQHARVRIQ